MVNAPKKREGDQLMIRFPPGSDLRERLHKAADENRRSLSAEVIHRLEMSLEGVEARLAALGDAINVTSDLAYDTHEHGWDVDGRLRVLEAFSKAVSAKTGVAIPTLDGLASGKPKRGKKG